MLFLTIQKGKDSASKIFVALRKELFGRGWGGEGGGGWRRRDEKETKKPKIK